MATPYTLATLATLRYPYDFAAVLLAQRLAILLAILPAVRAKMATKMANAWPSKSRFKSIGYAKVAKVAKVLRGG